MTSGDPGPQGADTGGAAADPSSPAQAEGEWEESEVPPPEAPIPELRPAVRVDRWAHRRVEPRGLALLWTLYLLGITLTTFWTPTTGAGLDPLAGRYASRQLLFSTAVGYAVLWPMLRLCQVFPGDGGLKSVGKDLLVMVIPTQAVVWPLAFLALWPMSVAAALGAQSLAWTLLVGALLAMALGPGGSDRRPSAIRRVVWMVVILAAGARPAGLYDFRSAATGFDLWTMSSALTAPLSLTVPPQGRVAWLGSLQWSAIGVTFGVSVGLWLVAAALSGRSASGARAGAA